MLDQSSLEGQLKQSAELFGSRIAIAGDGGVELSHRRLREHVGTVLRDLREAGIRREHRVAMVFPQSPDLAVAFLAVSSGAAAAPLNPAYSLAEFQFNLQDLSAQALLVPKGFQTPARAAAQTLGIPVLELALLQDGGRVVADGHALQGVDALLDFSDSEDVALLLHTSGTTSRPKRVPLSNRNLCASARNVAATLHLTEADVSLSTMPLFHVHGLVCMLAALSVGGSCVCTGPFRADQFPLWLERWQPTWFSSVPTAFQALLDVARTTPLRTKSLRLIRSSSASLPPAVMAGLEDAFGVPVIEAYGMTEAAHQMASNPLPPAARKPGSVGLPAGPRIVILDEEGNQLAQGATGEVSIHGTNVTCGYEANPSANEAAFTNGWFRTGDQGYFDPEGYLFLTGRLKELINRGGEKIVPRKIDEVMLCHPAVRQAVTFAVAHPSLGEDVAMAVVLHAGASVTEAELRAFLLERLADFKVPSRVVKVDAIPLGPTGKIQRIGMAARLEAFLGIAYEDPTTSTEELVASTIAQVLGLDRVGRNDNFFMLGGDSLRGAQVASRLARELRVAIAASLLFHEPTPKLLAARLDALVVERELEALAAAIADLTPEEQAELLGETPPTT